MDVRADELYQGLLPSNGENSDTFSTCPYKNFKYECVWCLDWTETSSSKLHRAYLKINIATDVFCIAVIMTDFRTDE